MEKQNSPSGRSENVKAIIRYPPHSELKLHYHFNCFPLYFCKLIINQGIEISLLSPRESGKIILYRKSLATQYGNKGAKTFNIKRDKRLSEKGCFLFYSQPTAEVKGRKYVRVSVFHAESFPAYITRP